MQQFYLTRPQSFPYPYHPYGNWPQDPANAYPILMAAQNHYQPQRLFMGVVIAEKGTDKPITEVRVENQFRTIVALRQFPPSIKRIRLQPNNLAPVYKYKKEELLEAERIKVEASPDMLDLFAAVVRTSCVETPEGRARAFREAAANFNYDGKPNVPEEKQETDTGLMAQNCPSCCGREEKRVRRKHGWTNEHKRSYIEAAANRVICFEYKANQEHFELYGANGSSIADGKSQLTKKPSFATVGPDGTIQLDFETRIYCYSRHVSKASPSSKYVSQSSDHKLYLIFLQRLIDPQGLPWQRSGTDNI